MIKELIKLSNAGGISGFEYTVTPLIEELLTKYCDEVKKDVSGNVIGYIWAEDKNAPTVMIEAHTDGIGLMVKDIDENGFISGNAMAENDGMEITVAGNEQRILLIARYDNLGKGASGAALECMNFKMGQSPEFMLNI